MWLKANKNEKQKYTTVHDFSTNEFALVSILLLWKKNTLKSALRRKGFIFGHSSRSHSIFVVKSKKEAFRGHKTPTIKNRDKQVYACSLPSFLLLSLISSSLNHTGLSTYEMSYHTNWFRKKFQYRQVYRQNQLRQLLTDSCQVIPSV